MPALTGLSASCSRWVAQPGRTDTAGHDVASYAPNSRPGWRLDEGWRLPARLRTKVPSNVYLRGYCRRPTGKRVGHRDAAAAAVAHGVAAERGRPHARGRPFRESRLARVAKALLAPTELVQSSQEVAMRQIHTEALARTGRHVARLAFAGVGGRGAARTYGWHAGGARHHGKHLCLACRLQPPFPRRLPRRVPCDECERAAATHAG